MPRKAVQWATWDVTLAAVLEVIPMRRKAYAATPVNGVDAARLTRGPAQEPVVVGVDVGKRQLFAVCRWADGAFERPWKVHNPADLPALVALLRRLGTQRPLVVAMESSGAYGDALRQALADANIPVHRVGTKAAHDYAEVFDGVPSQHDGKDAAVVAELAALGKAVPWPYQPADDWEQELAYWVDWVVAQRRGLAMWQGRLEGLLARHWPGATRVLKLSSATLLRVLAHYGSPQALAADPQAARRLARWGGRLLGPAKAQRLVEAAHASQGVRAGAWERRRLQDFAEQALQARRQAARGQRRLRQLAHGLRSRPVAWSGDHATTDFPDRPIENRPPRVTSGPGRCPRRGRRRSR